MKKMIKYTVLLLCIQSAAFTSLAVMPGTSGWMGRFMILNSQQLSYNYTIQLVKGRGFVTDSIKGSLFRDGKKYLDSSSIGITAVDGNYFCKLDCDHKTAMIYNLAALERKMNVSVSDVPPAVMMFPDSVIARYGNLKTDSNARHYIIHLTISAPGNNIVLTALLSRKTRQVEQVIIDTPEPQAPGEKETWSRRCTLYNIRSEALPGIFDLHRFFTVSGNAVVLSNKYTNYKLTSIIN